MAMSRFCFLSLSQTIRGGFHSFLFLIKSSSYLNVLPHFLSHSILFYSFLFFYFLFLYGINNYNDFVCKEMKEKKKTEEFVKLMIKSFGETL